MTFFLGFALILLLIPMNYMLILISRKRVMMATPLVGIMMLSNMVVLGLYMVGTFPATEIISYVTGIGLAVFLNMMFKVVYVLNEGKLIGV